MDPVGEITTLLALESPLKHLDTIYEALYNELKAKARYLLAAESKNRTLQATSLVHEVYIRLVDQEFLPAGRRADFLRLAGFIMRQVLVDAARRRLSGKRSGEVLPIDDIEVSGTNEDMELLHINSVLEKLGSTDPRAAEAVQLRYFGGYELNEISEILGVSLATVKRDLAFGKAWLQKEVGDASTSV
jgi:RNA polymerase sigma factor (TIGR02999 family)